MSLLELGLCQYWAWRTRSPVTSAHLAITTKLFRNVAGPLAGSLTKEDAAFTKRDKYTHGFSNLDNSHPVFLFLYMTSKFFGGRVCVSFLAVFCFMRFSSSLGLDYALFHISVLLASSQSQIFRQPLWVKEQHIQEFIHPRKTGWAASLGILPMRCRKSVGK